MDVIYFFIIFRFLVFAFLMCAGLYIFKQGVKIYQSKTGLEKDESSFNLGNIISVSPKTVGCVLMAVAISCFFFAYLSIPSLEVTDKGTKVKVTEKQPHPQGGGGVEDKPKREKWQDEDYPAVQDEKTIEEVFEKKRDIMP